MDQDLMTRSSYGKVIFNSVDWTPEQLVCQFYPKYIYEDVKTSVLCSVGLYVVPKNNPEDFIIKQEIFVVLKALGEDIQLHFERSKLPRDDGSFYIFQFMNELGEVMGASTPFKIQALPPSPTGSNESDEFVVISQSTSRIEDELPSPRKANEAMNSFVVLSEHCKSVVDNKKVKEEEEVAIEENVKVPIMSESLFSMVDSVEEKKLSEMDSEPPSLDPTPFQDIHEETASGDKKSLEAMSKKCVDLESELEEVHSLLGDKNAFIAELEEEIRHKDKRIDELMESVRKVKEEDQRKICPLQDFQTLHKSDQLKIFQLEKELRDMETEVKRMSSLSLSEFESIKKNINELQASVGRSKSPSRGNSFDYLDSLVINKAMGSSSDTSKSEGKEESLQKSDSTSNSKSMPRILDDGRVVMSNVCSVCNKEFKDTNLIDFETHVNNHFSSHLNACPMCDKTFPKGQDIELEDHVQNHFEYEENETEEEEEEETPSDTPTSGPVGTGLKNIFKFINSLD